MRKWLSGAPMKVGKSKEYFAKNLKRLRIQAGITQAELAERAGVSTRLVQKLEGRAARNITLETLDRFAKALKVNGIDMLNDPGLHKVAKREKENYQNAVKILGNLVDQL
jgi:transcriptional regulator with XRE-family HTH domain